MFFVVLGTGTRQWWGFPGWAVSVFSFLGDGPHINQDSRMQSSSKGFLTEAFFLANMNLLRHRTFKRQKYLKRSPGRPSISDRSPSSPSLIRIALVAFLIISVGMVRRLSGLRRKKGRSMQNPQVAKRVVLRSERERRGICTGDSRKVVWRNQELSSQDTLDDA